MFLNAFLSIFSVTPFEDYSAKCFRLRDEIPDLTKPQLIHLTRLLVEKWDQTKIRDSGLVQALIEKLDTILLENKFTHNESLNLALLMGSFQYLEKILYPSRTLNSSLDGLEVNQTAKEDLILVLLLASCCHGKIVSCDHFHNLGIAVEDQLLMSFETLSHPELAVGFQGLQTLSPNLGLKLKFKMEAKYGFRM